MPPNTPPAQWELGILVVGLCNDSVDTVSSQLKQVCAGNEDLCELVRELLSAGAYEPWIQVLLRVDIFLQIWTFLFPI